MHKSENRRDLNSSKNDLRLQVWNAVYEEIDINKAYEEFQKKYTINCWGKNLSSLEIGLYT